MFKRISFIILIFFLITSATPASAQTPSPTPGPVYIVREGDSLWDIASRFNVSVNDLETANAISGGNIFPGDKLVIPGLEGLSGTLITQPVPLGGTLLSLSREYHVDPALLRKLNHIVSPTELYVGAELIFLQQDNQPALSARVGLGQGETLLELAVKGGSDPWTVTQINGLSGASAGLPGDVLYLPSGESTASSTGLPSSILSAELDPLPLLQGSTAQIKVITSQKGSLSGQLADKPLQFFATDPTTQIALQGIHAMTDPGIYPFRLDFTGQDGTVQSFEQMVLVKSGKYPAETINGVDPQTIDPAITGPEDEWLLSLTSKVTPDKYWSGTFQLPVDSQYCVRSGYGNRRSYNGGVLNTFHTGIDFGVCSETHPFDVYAPADGVVVFTGLKTVRGNATIIDHGWGIFSGLYHQEETYVKAGDHVTAGQLIGKIGATGRVTGAHLHWDLWVNGIQVNPLLWLDKAFPH